MSEVEIKGIPKKTSVKVDGKELSGIVNRYAFVHDAQNVPILTLNLIVKDKMKVKLKDCKVYIEGVQFLIRRKVAKQLYDQLRKQFDFD